MLIREVADNSKYYHDALASQLPAGLTDDNDIVGKAFMIAGMKLGMVKAARIFRETPGFEQDLVLAYHQLHNDLKETVVDDELATAQEIGAQLQSAMEDLYYAHRMSNPNPTVKQNIDMLQKSIRSFNQELNGLGYKYAPTLPGLVARMGTRYVEDIDIEQMIESSDTRVAPVAPPLRIQPTRTQPNQNVYVAPEKKTPAAIIHIGKKEVKEFAPPGGDDREPDEEHILRQLAAQWWLGTEQQMARAQQALQSMGWEIGQDESGDDDAGVFVIRAGDINGDSYIAFPHSELSLDEGFRVANQQIPGTKNRAQSAYYPSSKKPTVPKLDKPLTDQELARLSQLAGIKTNK
jgi:hypothetical protein